MDEARITELAKQAYALSIQITGIEAAMNAGKDAISGYSSYAINFNSLLEKAKRILATDETILETIVHLRPYDPQKASGYIKEFEGIKADLPVLKGAFSSFSELHFPAKEKEKIGFRP